jgi:hypothetical protein
MIKTTLKAGLANHRMLTLTYDTRTEAGRKWRQGPFELWDTTTGAWIARLDKPDIEVHDYQLMAEGRWVIGIEIPSVMVVFATDDGRQLGRWPHPDLGRDESIMSAFSPTGRWLITQVGRGYGSQYISRFYTWEAATWRQLPGPVSSRVSHRATVHEPKDGLIVISHSHETMVCRPGQAEPLARLEGELRRFDVSAGVTALGTGGTVLDLLTGLRRTPPAGRRFHPDLARCAQDGRFVLDVAADYVSVIDTVTDKRLSTAGDHDMFSTQWQPFAFRPGFGALGIIWSAQSKYLSHEARIILVPSHPALVPPDVLELWAQVVVRGEIGQDGNFAPWDEPTWERKRQELAARPVPPIPFPFPGHVAADRLHWLRAEYFTKGEPADQRRLAEELLRRAEALGDRAEATRRRAELGR